MYFDSIETLRRRLAKAECDKASFDDIDILRRRLEKAESDKAICDDAVAGEKADIANLLDHLSQLVKVKGEGTTEVDWGGQRVTRRAPRPPDRIH